MTRISLVLLQENRKRAQASMQKEPPLGKEGSFLHV